jgi:reductive dehalogenase
MGYRAEAEHSRHYTTLMVPLAVQAGLGEYGRLGYLITERFGPRVRLFMVTTDLPMAEDRPVDLGADAFCRVCKKCAESCPSKSLPLEDKEIVRGVEKWRMDAESCYRYWARVGTDCSVCMAVCPFARPDTLVHRLVRRLVKRSNLARKWLPHVDNFLYGRRWKPRRAPEWIDYPRSKAEQNVPPADEAAKD